MSEYTPPWRKVRMTKAQMIKYLADTKKARDLAQAKLDEARKNWEFDKDEDEVARLAKLLDDTNQFT